MILNAPEKRPSCLESPLKTFIELDCFLALSKLIFRKISALVLTSMALSKGQSSLLSKGDWPALDCLKRRVELVSLVAVLA